MSALRRDRDPSGRRVVRRAVVLMPNGLTLANLLCGIYALILSIRGDLASAPSFIVLGGIADVLDGRVARATGTGSRFGEELDSLVDAISFGFAPALMVYLGLPNRGSWEWLFIFFFTSCAVMRLARFNVEQAGRKKTHFHGLPSPAAGLTLATYYWFAQTPLYNQTVILFTDSKTLASFPWHTILLGLMATLAALMISDVPYPAVPSIGFRNLRQILATLVVAASVVLLVVRREEFIFPALLAYVLYGVIKWLFIGFLGRASTPDEIYWEKEAELHRPREERTSFEPSTLDDELADAMDDADDAEVVTAGAQRTSARGARQPREVREPRESREPRGDGENRESRDGRRGSRRERGVRSSREARANRESREPRETREPREAREPRETRDAREPREARQTREPREPREAREDRDAEGSHDHRELRTPPVARAVGGATQESALREPFSSRESNDPNDSNDSNDSNDLNDHGEDRESESTDAGEQISNESEVAGNSSDQRSADGAPPAKRRRRRRGGNRGNRSPGATPPGPTLPDTPTGPAE